MQRIYILISAVVLIASTGFAETLITAQDHAVDSDVVLESAVKDVKAIPQDAVNVAGDTVTFLTDEVHAAAEGVKSAFRENPVTAVKQAAAIETASAWDASNNIIFRSYKIDPNVGKDILTAAVENENDRVVDVHRFFDGISFPEGTSAYYRPEFNRLLVRQTFEQLLAIEATLAEQHNAHRELMGHQVEIKTKFVEVSQQTLNELGFDWTFGNDNGNPFDLGSGNLLLPEDSSLLSAGLRSANKAFNGPLSDSVRLFREGGLDVDVVISAMEQADDTDVLSAPRIVTRNGKTAIIKVGEKRAVPAAFRVGSQQSSLYVEHTGWKNEVMGVVLEATPQLRSDNLIDLKLKPRVIDLIGYDDYEISPDNATMLPVNGAAWSYGVLQQGRYPVLTETVDGIQNVYGALLNSVLGASAQTAREDVNDTSEINGNISNAYFDQRRMWDDSELIQVPSLHGKLPYFRIREIETEVTVNDGSTVGMGGLIYDKLETYRDKVPVLGSVPLLGRLFRSEGERSIKRNLIIFVTATQVDVNGQRNADLVLKK